MEDVCWLPTLAQGRQRWRIGTQGSTLVTEIWQVNGKVRSVCRNITAAGRQATPAAQAVHQANKKWRDRQEKRGFTQEHNETAAVVRPMLAQQLTLKHRKRTGITEPSISLPCFVQPKLDGLRCLAHWDGVSIRLESRTGIPFLLPHLSQALCSVLTGTAPPIALDGELYTPDIPFEELSGVLRSCQHQDRGSAAAVRFCIFDCIVAFPLSFSARYSCLQKLPLAGHPTLELVRTDTASNWADVLTLYQGYMAQGYEGLIARADAPYEVNKRSKSLQKYKQFQDAEFTITGYEQAEGLDAGTVIWRCTTEQGVAFSVRPRGSRELRAQWFRDGEAYVGQRLTVRFQELSANGVPRFPVGVAIRHPGD